MERQRIYLLQFSDQYTMTATFLRFQERYESPKFYGKVFDWEEFMDWYAKQYGNFTYFQDWSGFNIPSYALMPFYDGTFDPLTRKEKKLLNLLEDISGNFYVIGTMKVDADTLGHEIVHGLFCLHSSYRREVIRCIRKYNPKRIKKAIAKKGYHRSTILDEINSFLVTGLAGIIDPRSVKRLQQALKQIFIKRFGFAIWEKRLPFLVDMVHVIDFPIE